MANISLTLACNRACSYCFARGLVMDPAPSDRHMPPEVFERALDFLIRSKIGQARLLGGEPTLHPQFGSWVNTAVGRGLNILVFSNGLMPQKALEGLCALSPPTVDVLINTPTREAVTARQWHRLSAVLGRLGPRARLGFNFLLPSADPGFLLDLIDGHGLQRTIRLGLAHPGLGAKNRFLHPRHYPAIGDRIVALAEKAARRKVELDFDCGFVPCMFPDHGAGLGANAAAQMGRRCNPILDILPNGRLAACYPLSGVFSQRMQPDDTADAIRARLNEDLAPYRSLGIYRQCALCRLRADDRCNGGCRAAAMQRLRPGPPMQMINRGRTGAIATLGSRCRGESRRLDAASSDFQEKLKSRPVGWVLPYVDQPLDFWQKLAERYGPQVRQVYFPLPLDTLGSGRPGQPRQHLAAFLRQAPVERCAVINPITLPDTVRRLAPAIVTELKRLIEENGISSVTLANATLGALLRERFPQLELTASVLMDIREPLQIPMLDGIFDGIVPASSVVRDLPRLKRLRAAFGGKLRLIVNEACLPGCPHRVQHFHEMAHLAESPRSLCQDLLTRQPWLRLTGAWVLPQHLHLYSGICDEWKLAGRVTLKDPGRYLRVLDAYVNQTPLTPDRIGGGPASVLMALPIDEAFFEHTLNCGRDCHRCSICRDYYHSHSAHLADQQKEP
jgi:hypothetical protein